MNGRFVALSILGVLGSLTFLLLNSNLVPKKGKSSPPNTDIFINKTIIPVGWFANTEIQESSSLAYFKGYSNVLWTANDSGGLPVIYPFAVDGSEPEDLQPLKILGVQNKDWETFAYDQNRSILYIGDVGNNQNKRADLTIHSIKIPNKLKNIVSLRPDQSFNVCYEDQKAFPPKKLYFDCEAMLVLQKKLLFLTKHRGNTDTTIYILKSPELGLLQKKMTLPVRGQVTGASQSPNEQKVAILTYRGIWVFEAFDDPMTFWKGSIRYREVNILQCEAITFTDAQTLWITNEQGAIFSIEVSEIPRIENPF